VSDQRDVSTLLWALLFGLAAAAGLWQATGHHLSQHHLVLWGSCALIALGLLGGLLTRRRP